MSIQDLSALIDQASAYKEQVDEKKEQLKDIQKELDKLNKMIVEYFEENNLKSIKGETYMAYTVERRSLKIEDRNEFFSWLRDKGIFDDVISVSSQKLGPLYNEELELAKESGDFGFLEKGIPGLSSPTTHKTVSYKRIKK